MATREELFAELLPDEVRELGEEEARELWASMDREDGIELLPALGYCSERYDPEAREHIITQVVRGEDVERTYRVKTFEEAKAVFEEFRARVHGK